MDIRNRVWNMPEDEVKRQLSNMLIERENEELESNEIGIQPLTAIPTSLLSHIHSTLSFYAEHTNWSSGANNDRIPGAHYDNGKVANRTLGRLEQHLETFGISLESRDM